MKAGEKTRCPHCGEDTVVKSKPKMEGWTRVGDVLVCALCAALLMCVFSLSFYPMMRRKHFPMRRL